MSTLAVLLDKLAEEDPEAHRRVQDALDNGPLIDKIYGLTSPLLKPEYVAAKLKQLASDPNHWTVGNCIGCRFFSKDAARWGVGQCHYMSRTFRETRETPAWATCPSYEPRAPK